MPSWSNAVRSTVEAHVSELDELAASSQELADALESLSVPLEALRERFGGDEGVVVDGFGDPHALSLAKWTTSDPETRLIVWFSHRQRDAPAELRGSIHPSDVLAKAYPPLRRLDDD